MQISYPNTVILLRNDNVKDAFRLVKNNSAVVGMYGFVTCKQLAFCNGMTFGDVYSLMNFDSLEVARTQFAKYLWMNKAEETIK